MKVLKRSVETAHPLYKCCSLLFCKIWLQPALAYERKNDQIIGFQDTFNRDMKLADHAIVLMAKSLRKN